jgi:hypothetical protein
VPGWKRSGAHYLLRPIFAGVGAIFMLRHVRPGRDAEFQLKTAVERKGRNACSRICFRSRAASRW